jgi:fructose-1,6-bisphosphatase/inositol monophosphatase family enzyme
VKSEYEFGEASDSLVGAGMRDMVRRIIGQVFLRRWDFIAEAKPGASGKLDDVVTSSDREAQSIYQKLISERFPTFGIVAEEDNLRIPSTHKQGYFFTLDPVDGTKAFVRKQSYGVATMIALCTQTKVVAAYVGDVLNGEIYGFRPGSKKVHRIGRDRQTQSLLISQEHSLREQYVLLRDHPEVYSSFSQQIAKPRGIGMFKNIEISGGSLGITFTRLWKGEVGAILLTGHRITPWDWNPIVGISTFLGFRFFEVDALQKKQIKTYEPVLSESARYKSEPLVIHESRLEELKNWL